MQLAVASVVFVVYAVTASPLVGWLDSAELVTGMVQLGVPHPPGHPLPMFLGHVVGLVPVGDLAFRASVASALAGAGAAAALFGAARTLGHLVSPALPARIVVATAAGAALGASFLWSLWFQAVRAEVYALTLALVLLSMAHALVWLTTREPRRLHVCALAAALALVTHSLMAVAALAVAAVLVMAKRPGWRSLLTGLGTGIVGLGALVYLPVRAARDPIPDWGDPDTLSRFVWVVTGKAFQRTASMERADSAAFDAAEVVATLVEQLGVVVASLAVVGFVLLVRAPRSRAVSVALGGTVLASVVARALVGFEGDNPDAHGYLTPALVALVLAALVPVWLVGEKLSARSPRAVFAAALTLSVLWPASRVVQNAGDASLHEAHAAQKWGETLLAESPPGALLVTTHFETIFLLWYLQHVEGARPDIDVLDRGQLSYPGNAEVTRERMPHLAALVDAPLSTSAVTPVDELIAIAAARPVRIEPHFTLEPELASHLVLDGALARFFEEPPPPRVRDILGNADVARVAGWPLPDRAGAPWDRLGLVRALLWSHFMRAELHCALERRADLVRSLSAIDALAPGDSEARRLAERCL